MAVMQENYTECPTRYRTRHEDIAMKFEQEYVRCVRNEEECVCSVCVCVMRLIVATRSSSPPAISSLVVKLLKKCRVQ